MERPSPEWGHCGLKWRGYTSGPWESVEVCGTKGQSVRIEGFREQTPIPLSPRGIQVSPLRRVSNSKCSRSDSHGPWQESSLYCSHTRLYSINKQIQSRRERRPPPGLASEPSTESLLSQGERLPIMVLGEQFREWIPGTARA